MDTTSIIIAVASPSGRSLHGIVRLSGNGTPALLSGHLRTGDDASLTKRGSHVARIPLGAGTLPALVLTSPGPTSYTGEDAAEIQLPGNDFLLNRVIDDLLDSARRRDVAARRAEPGEFTARAWLNGRLDLTQAEGVATLVAARSDAELRAGRLLIEGKLGRDAGAWADRIASALALVEAGIDFTDQEDVVPITPRNLLERLAAVYQEIGETLARATGSEQLEAIPWVVLRGAPNAGKSTLFNTLLGHERAVVADVAGTTRDALAEPMVVDTPRGPAEIMLADVAGDDDDDAQDELAALMQETARDTRRRADLVLLCAPAGAQESPVAEAENTLVVRTKCDLAPAPPDLGLAVSARNGTGLATLREAIATRLADRAVSIGAASIVLRPRHDAALRAAHEHLSAGLELVEPRSRAPALADAELIAASLRAALDELGTIAGSISPDEILGRVFATFCVGK